MHVIINESQLDIFRRLTESDTPQLNNGSVKEFGDSSEVTINPTITDADGNPKRSKPEYTDDISAFLANQNWGSTIRARGL